MLCFTPSDSPISVSELERSPTTRRNAAFQGPSFPSTPPIGFQHFIPTQHANVTHTMQVWLLDQFGVLHDGKQPYPGAISTCKYYYSTLSLFFNLFFLQLFLFLPLHIFLFIFFLSFSLCFCS